MMFSAESASTTDLGALIVTTNRKAWVESKSQADLTALGAVMVVGNATFNPAVRALTLKDIENVEALSLVKGKVVRDPKKCIGCGVCVVYCPTRAWTRSKEHYFRVVLLGRTGKRNPRLAEDFIKWCDEESILKMVKNAYAYIEEYIDPNAVEHKEHIGYIVDRTGFEEFKKFILKDVTLPEKAEVTPTVYWGGLHYDGFGK